MRIEHLSIIVNLIFLGFIFYQIWKQRLCESYALLWIFLSLVCLFFSIFPRLMMAGARSIGIYYAPSALLLAMSVGAFMILFQFSLVLSRRAREVKELTQALALLEKRVRELEEAPKANAEEQP